MVLSLSGLQFLYGTTCRLNLASFSLKERDCVALFGQNGSGKSTLLSMLSGILPIHRGSVYMLGQEAVSSDHYIKRELKTSLGVLFQGGSSDEKLSSLDNLRYAALLMGISSAVAEKSIALMLKQANLTDRAHEPVKKLSGGMKRRLELYRTFLHKPKLLLLDEPTAGLDVKESARFFHFLKAYQQETNASVLMATHNPEEATACDRVVMMKDGQIIADGSPTTMLSTLTYVRLSLNFKEQVHRKDFSDMPWFDVSEEADGTIIKAKISTNMVADFLRHPLLINPKLKSLSIIAPSLADVYEVMAQPQRD